MNWNSDTALNRSTDKTPCGVVVFTVSFTSNELMGEEATNFVAVAHHLPSGAMTVGRGGIETGEAGYRLACANAVSGLYHRMQHQTNYNRMFEASYAH